MKQKPICERGDAALLAAAFAIIVLVALALPAYECGRMLSDKIIAAAAATDTAGLVSADPDTSTFELERYLKEAYPMISDAATLEVMVGDSELGEYDDKVFDNESGEYRTFSRTVSSQQITTQVHVTRPFVTTAAVFLSGIGGGSGSYTVSASGIATIDATVTSGGW